MYFHGIYLFENNIVIEMKIKKIEEEKKIHLVLDDDQII